MFSVLNWFVNHPDFALYAQNRHQMGFKNLEENPCGRSLQTPTAGGSRGLAFICAKLRSYLLPITAGVIDDGGRIVTKECGAVLVRNWRQSPLCFVNSAREALAGRNLWLEFPLEVELDGDKKTTRVIGKKTSVKKSRKK
jgi:hypothetical protein